jgi:DNA-binding Lrp family transcriptional regulator
MRILRLCLHEARTNKELAEELGLNPGTLLHHVRTLVATGFLEPLEPRRGERGAKEVPYLATRRSWTTPVHGGGSPVIIETFLQEIRDLPPDVIDATRLGLKLNAENRQRLLDRFNDLFQEIAAMPADADGEPISLLFVEHPDLPHEWKS